jgi:arylsulfatase
VKPRPPFAAKPHSRPNILFLLADDLGFSDLGAFGGEISTPNLDDLAAEGRLLLNHHSAFTCAPTRAMINAGTDQHVTGIGNQSIKPFQRGKPGYEGFLNDRSLYLAELLGDGGYHTYIAGKWHLGEDEGQLPPDRGYERSYVLLPGVGNHFGPRPDAPVPSDTAQLGGLIQIAYREDGQPVTPPADFFSSTFYTDKLIEYIESNRGDRRPFFAFATYTAPHWPLQAPDDFIDRYQGRYDQGWEVIRQARVERQKALGLFPNEFPPISRCRRRPSCRRTRFSCRQARRRCRAGSHCRRRNVGTLPGAWRSTRRWSSTSITRSDA